MPNNLLQNAMEAAFQPLGQRQVEYKKLFPDAVAAGREHAAKSFTGPLAGAMGLFLAKGESKKLHDALKGIVSPVIGVADFFGLGPYSSAYQNIGRSTAALRHGGPPAMNKGLYENLSKNLVFNEDITGSPSDKAEVLADVTSRWKNLGPPNKRLLSDWMNAVRLVKNQNPGISTRDAVQLITSVVKNPAMTHLAGPQLRTSTGAGPITAAVASTNLDGLFI